MNKVRLSKPQIELLREFIQTNNDRPTPDQYDAFQRRMGRLTPKPKLRPRDIPNTRKGYNRGEVVPLDEFNADNDLPEGWAIVNCWDSGNNHGIEGAGVHLMRNIWNAWTPGNTFTFPGNYAKYKTTIMG